MRSRLIFLLWLLLGAAAGAAPEQIAAHPRLFFTAGELPALRRKFNAPQFADYKKCLLAEAAAQMEYRGEDGKAEPGSAYKLWAQRREESLSALLWASVLTGEKPYRDKLMEVARDEMQNFHFDPKRFEEEFNFMPAAFMAAIYDALYNELSAGDRTAFQKYLDSAYPSFHAVEAKGGSWGFGNNIGAVFFGAAGVVALARTGETPEAGKILNECLHGLGQFQKETLGRHPDGAYPESSLYWDFGLTWYLCFADALKRATGDDHQLLEFPFLKNNVHYVETLLGGDNHLFTFGDTQPLTFGAAIGAALGARYDQPLMRWLADRNVRDAAHGDPALAGERPFFHELAFLWRDARPAPRERPAMPMLSILDSVDWGVLRSDGGPVPALELGVKGHPGYPLNHHPPDAASFVLLVQGEPFLIAPGYYQGALEDHNVVVVKGSEQTGEALAKLAGERNGGIGKMTVTLFSHGGPEPILTRTFIMIGSKAVVILDDVPAGHATTSFQSGRPAELLPGQSGAVLSGSNHRLYLQSFGPIKTLGLSGPRDFGKSWIFARLAKDGRMVWQTIRGEYDAEADRPEVTVLSVAGPKAGVPEVEVRREAGMVIVTLPGGDKLRFMRDEAGKSWRYAE